MHHTCPALRTPAHYGAGVPEVDASGTQEVHRGCSEVDRHAREGYAPEPCGIESRQDIRRCDAQAVHAEFLHHKSGSIVIGNSRGREGPSGRKASRNPMRPPSIASTRKMIVTTIAPSLGCVARVLEAC